jgi:hypothetical protein
MAMNTNCWESLFKITLLGQLFHDEKLDMFLERETISRPENRPVTKGCKVHPHLHRLCEAFHTSAIIATTS